MKNLFYLLFAATMFLVACETEEVNLADEQLTVGDEAMVESTFQEIDNMTFVGISENGGRIKQDGRFSCATITHSNDSLIIDFGDGCEGPHGRVRAGMVIITRTAPFWQTGAIITTTFHDFSIDGNQIFGIRKQENLGLNDNGNHMFGISLEDGKIIFTDSTEIQRNSTFTRTWVRGANMMEDELHVEGSANGITRGAVEYSMEITDPLVYTAVCRHEGFPMAVQGEKELVIGDKLIYVDFGDGNCDNIITLTYNGHSTDVEVDMRHGHHH